MKLEGEDPNSEYGDSVVETGLRRLFRNLAIAKIYLPLIVETVSSSIRRKARKKP